MQHRDPVCGMTVDSATAEAESTYGSHHFYFCSKACRDRFDADPTRYAGATAAGRDENVELEGHEPPIMTKDGITVPKFGSAGSGGAEYERIPEQHDRD